MKKVEMKCRAFSGENVRVNQIAVEEDGTVLVYDSVACHYTTCHSMCESAIRRARKLAS